MRAKMTSNPSHNKVDRHFGR